MVNQKREKKDTRERIYRQRQKNQYKENCWKLLSLSGLGCFFCTFVLVLRENSLTAVENMSWIKTYANA